MKSIDAMAKDKNRTLTEQWLDGFARRVMLKTLKRIKIGHLTIEEQGQVYSFGEPKESAEIIAHVFVSHPSAYRYVLFNGTIGSGEAYMLKAWSSSDLVQVIRLFVANMALVQAMDSRWSQISQTISGWVHRLRANSKTGSRKNIAAHYDLGNDFFKLFLDPTMLYSSAIYASEDSTLEEASLNKLQRICTRLGLSEQDHLLEIGTGWGGMAIYAAQHFGCRVTTVTISQEQYEYARAWVAREGLQDKVEVRLQDYRDVSGQFDKLVSIEMVEAVGYKYLPQYFGKCSSLLKPNGKMLMQTITIADQRYEAERDNVDFIQKYIFPGGCLPSIEVITQHLSQDTDMQLVGLEDITFHYAKTLAEWRKRFFAEISAVRAMGFDDVFIRMWDFYLSYCEGGFRERAIGTSQLVFAKPQCRDLPAVD